MKGLSSFPSLSSVQNIWLSATPRWVSSWRLAASQSFQAWCCDSKAKKSGGGAFREERFGPVETRRKRV